MKNASISSPSALGQAIRIARTERELTQKEMGAKVGVDQSTVSGVENGNAGTRLDTLFHLLAALDLEISLCSRKAKPTAKNREEW